MLIHSDIKDLVSVSWNTPTELNCNILHLSNSAKNRRNKITASFFLFFFVLSELDLNRLDGDTVCPPMRSGQDDLPGNDLYLGWIQIKEKAAVEAVVKPQALKIPRRENSNYPKEGDEFN